MSNRMRLILAYQFLWFSIFIFLNLNLNLKFCYPPMTELSQFFVESGSSIRSFLSVLLKSLVCNFNAVPFPVQMLIFIASFVLLFAGLHFKEFSLSFILILILFASIGGYINIFAKLISNTSIFIQNNFIEMSSAHLNLLVTLSIALAFAAILICFKIHLVIPFVFTFGFLMAASLYSISPENSEVYLTVFILTILVSLFILGWIGKDIMELIDCVFICGVCSFLIILFLSTQYSYFKNLIPTTWNSFNLKAIVSNLLTYIFTGLTIIGFVFHCPSSKKP